MDIMEAIRHRRSVRTFDGTSLRSEDAEKVAEYAQNVENPYELPIEWKILDAKRDSLSSPVIVGTDAWIAGKLKRAPHAEEAFGYAFEKIVLFAEMMGLGTTWIAGTMDRAAFERAMELAEDEVMPCVSPLGYPARKMSLRETMMRKGVKADSRFDFEKLFFDGSFEKPLTPAAARSLKPVLEAVRLAPSAVNKQPWRVVIEGGKAHFYEKQSKGFVDQTGWDLQKVDIGIAMAHFEIGAEEAGKHASLTVEDPGIEAGGLIYIASYTLE